MRTLITFFVIINFSVLSSAQLLFSSDFSNINDWDVETTGGTLTGEWDIVNVSSAFIPMESPTAGNGFARVSENLDPGVSILYTASPINKGTNDKITVEFFSSYLKSFTSGYISVVLLNTSFVEIDEVVLYDDVNIYDFESDFIRVLLDGGSEQFIHVGFKYESTSSGTNYPWEIDDVSVFVPNSYDANLRFPKLHTDFIDLANTDFPSYTKFPQSHDYNLNFTTQIRNVGLNTDNFYVESELNDLSQSTLIETMQTNSESIDPQDISGFLSLQHNVPNDIGEYSINAEIVLTSGSTNDGLSTTFDFPFEITESLLAKDRGINGVDYIDLEPLINNTNISTPYILSRFPIYGEGFLYTVKVGISPQSSTGFFKVLIYKNSQLWDEITDVEVTSADIGSIKDVVLSQPMDFEEEDEIQIYIALQDSQGNDYEDLYIASSGQNMNTMLDLITDESFNTIYRLPMQPAVIQLSFDPCDGPGLITPELTITEAYCPNSCDGEVGVNNFFPEFDYTWLDGSLNSIGTSDNLTDLCNDDYMLIAEGCNDADTINFSIEGNQQFNFVDITSSNATNCSSNDGSISIDIESTNDYTFTNLEITYSGPENGSIFVTSDGDYTINDLTSGNYEITLLDADNDCDPLIYNISVDYDEFDIPVCLVTVDSASASYNIVVWEKPSDVSAIDSFYIYREVTTNNYAHIGSVHVDSLSEYEDFDANPNSTGYRYKLSVLDVCGNESNLSDYHNTIHLQYQGNGNFNWNHYQIENQTGVVSSYNFYRDNYDDGNWQVLQFVSGNQNTYSDIDYALFPDANYRVEVDFGIGACTSTRAQDYNSSRSNRIKSSFGGSGDDTLSVTTYEQNSFNVYPNPTTEMLYIDTDYDVKSIKIFSALGQCVYEGRPSNLNSINVATLNTGIYTITLYTHQGKALRSKFLKK